MNERPGNSSAGESSEQQAAAWVLRCDRGLTAAEQDDLSAWLASHPQHGEQLARHRRHWRRLDTLAHWRPEHATHPNPDLLAPPLRVRFRRWRPAVLTLAAAAAVALGAYVYLASGTNLEAMRTGETAVDRAAPSQRSLPDGSKVEINRGAELTVEFTPAERRVRLERGEAHFFVEKDAERPFIVNAGGIDVRAVGTAFNVRLDQSAVEVLVTEGRVRVDSCATGDAGSPQTTSKPIVEVLEARQRAVVARPTAPATPPAAQIATLTPREIERVLSWQHRLLDFNATPLKDIVAEFNRRNATQVFIVDPELAALPMTATLRSDNIDGFVRLIEEGFGAKAEQRGENEILLRKVK